jgi:hypothetical protein
MHASEHDREPAVNALSVTASTSTNRAGPPHLRYLSSMFAALRPQGNGSPQSPPAKGSQNFRQNSVPVGLVLLGQPLQVCSRGLSHVRSSPPSAPGRVDSPTAQGLSGLAAPLTLQHAGPDLEDPGSCGPATPPRGEHSAEERLPTQGLHGQLPPPCTPSTS